MLDLRCAAERVLLVVFFLATSTCSPPSGLSAAEAAEQSAGESIRPFEAEPRYWQYKGKPVLLLGGTGNDNLFQWTGLRLIDHLDMLASVGGNYIRNTMSDRDEGDARAFFRGEDGAYDLERFSDDYWNRFETLLKETAKRDIIVQIEVWDRFDHAREEWLSDPFRPANNVNYTTADTGFANEYPRHPARDDQPFFHTIPGMERYEPRFDKVRRYQERFVEKLLSYSLSYGNVLYCMNNETSTDPAWGRFWMEFIRAKAHERGVEVFVTDMFDDGWKPEQSEKFRQAFDQPDVYRFIDISQVNSRSFGEDHWTHLRWVIEQVAAAGPRPVNHVKIYGSGETSFGSGTPADGIERFWRNVVAGSASSRFHRNGSGNGLKPNAQAAIRAMRKAESLIKLWDVEADNSLLSDREEDEAYLAARPGAAYLLYFTEGGAVKLDLSAAEGKFTLHWVDITTGQWGLREELLGGAKVEIGAPSAAPWAAAIVPAE